MERKPPPNWDYDIAKKSGNALDRKTFVVMI
jgi:hypothetical protein